MDSMDDDFGELYADVEVEVKNVFNGPDFSALSTQPDENSKNTEFNSEDCLASVSRIDLQSDDDCDDSDSEDEFRIVLNDEDCEKFEITRDGSSGGGKDDGGSDQVVDDELELNSTGKDMHFGDLNAWQQQHYLQSKWVNLKTSTHGYTGPTSFSSVLAGGDGQESGCYQPKGSTSSVPHSAYVFSLPWYRTILDVDIDSFLEKPWNHLEANISDFFNFGFNEASWKSYCGLLGQFRDHTALQTKKTVHESVDFSRPEGRVIEVEESIGERRPSKRVKRMRIKDSDVVILINIDDSGEDFSSSGKEELPHINSNYSAQGQPLNELQNLEHDVIVPSCDRASIDEISADLCEKEVRNTDFSSALRRFSKPEGVLNQTSAGSDHGNNQISDGNGQPKKENLSVCCLKRTSKELGALKCGEKVNSRKACILEPELALADCGHRCFSQSFSTSNSDGSKNSIPGDTVKVYSISKSLSPNSGAVAIRSDDKDSISHGSCRKPDDSSYHLKQRCRNQEDLKERSRRYQVNKKLRHYSKTDGAVFSQLDGNDNVKDYLRYGNSREEWKICNGMGRDVSKRLSYHENAHFQDRDIYYNKHCKSFQRQKQKLTDLDYHGREVFSLNKESDIFSGRSSERTGGKCANFPQKYPRVRNFRYRTDSYVSSRWDEKDEREYFHERNSRVGDQHYFERREAEYGLFVPEYAPVYRESVTERNDIDKSIVRRTDQNSRAQEYVEDDPMQEKYKRSLFSDRKRDYLDTICERDEKSHVRRSQYSGDCHCLDFDRSWGVEIGNVHERYVKHESLSSHSERECHRDNDMRWRDSWSDAYDTRLNERDYMDTIHDRDFPCSWRDEKFPVRRERNDYSRCLDLDRMQSMELENEFLKDLKHQFSSSHSRRECFKDNDLRWHDDIASMDNVSGRYSRHIGTISDDEHRDIVFSSIYHARDDANDISDANDYVSPHRRRNSWQPKELHRMNDELVANDRDMIWCAEKLAFSYENSSTCERISPRYEYDHDGMLSGGLQLDYHRHRLIREESRAKCDHRNYCIVDRGDWTVGEEKSFERWSKDRSLMFSREVEKTDLKLKERTNLVLKNSQYDGQQGDAINESKTRSSTNNQKRSYKFPVTEPNEDLDIEEGQIVPEETNTGEDLKKKQCSESTASTNNVKKSNSSENVSAGKYDNQCLLETLAKMEKRKQRFKNFMPLKKELKLQADSVVDSAETKSERPARRRRWN